MTLRRVAVIVAVAALAVIPPCIGNGHAQAAVHHHRRRHGWHDCARHPTSKLIGGLVDHNDHFARMPGPSCITVTDDGHRITIDRNYRPGRGVVAYDAIQFGDYPWSHDPRYGLPAPVAKVRTTMRVTDSAGPGYYLYDADIWFSRTHATGPLRHLREMIIGIRWRGYSPYDVTRTVKIGHRRWHVGAEMTGSRGNRHLLIRFLAVHPSRMAYIRLAPFLRIAQRHHWIGKAMTVDSLGYAPECWRGCRKLTYSAFPHTR